MRVEQCLGVRDPNTTLLRASSTFSSIFPQKPAFPVAKPPLRDVFFGPPAPNVMSSSQATMELRMTAVRKGQYDVEIVQAVEARKVLYDKSHEHHKNPRVKEVEWQRIGQELRVPAACVIKRWTVIRERFASEKRKVQQLGPSSWWLMNHMEWLDAHIQPRQRGKYSASDTPPPPPPLMAGLPNLTHISNLSNLPNLTHMSSFTTLTNNFNSNNTSIRYVNVGEPDHEDDDSRSGSPIMSIAYPEVCMKDISSDEEDDENRPSLNNTMEKFSSLANTTHNSTLDKSSSFANTTHNNSLDKAKWMANATPTPDKPYANGSSNNQSSNHHDNRSNGNISNNPHCDNGSSDGDFRGKRSASHSDESQQGPQVLGLDLEEAAAARLLAALKAIEDPIVRHRLRQRAHHLAEECELAALQPLHLDKKWKEEL